jgi:ubiquinone/menaquinone biosynthesis C-methylase UbiE
MTEYDRYVRAEWELFTNDHERAHDSLESVNGLSVSRVLDVGCGAGQELLPFVTKKNSLGVGVDVAPEVGRAGSELFAAHAPEAKVAFVRASAEGLPFSDESFDVAVCRIALPYMDNRRALSEMSRVLRPGGRLLLKIHSARYYLGKLRDGLINLNPLSVLHAVRVLTAGAIYHVAKRQPRRRFPSPETFQSAWLLRRELARYGLEIDRKLKGSNAATPSFVIIKRAARFALVFVCPSALICVELTMPLIGCLTRPTNSL